MKSIVVALVGAVVLTACGVDNRFTGPTPDVGEIEAMCVAITKATKDIYGDDVRSDRDHSAGRDSDCLAAVDGGDYNVVVTLGVIPVSRSGMTDYNNNGPFDTCEFYAEIGKLDSPRMREALLGDDIELADVDDVEFCRSGVHKGSKMILTGALFIAGRAQVKVAVAFLEGDHSTELTKYSDDLVNLTDAVVVAAATSICRAPIPEQCAN